MRIYVSGCTKTIRELPGHLRQHVGALVTPQNGNDIHRIIRMTTNWACDNSAYSNPDDFKFEDMVHRSWELMRVCPPDWISVPDVVGDHAATRKLFDLWIGHWEYEFGRVEWPLAFVLQNGCTVDDVPWAYDIGADSVDGSGYSMFGEKVLIPALKYMHGLKAQPTLFGSAA